MLLQLSTQIASRDETEMLNAPPDVDLTEPDEGEVDPSVSQHFITPRTDPNISTTPSSSSATQRKKAKTSEDTSFLSHLQERQESSREIQEKISKMIQSTNPRALTQKGWCTWLEGRMSDMHPKLLNEFYDRTYAVCQDIIRRSEAMRDNEPTTTTSATTTLPTVPAPNQRSDQTMHDMQPPAQSQQQLMTSYTLPSGSGFQQPDSHIHQVGTDNLTASGQVAWGSAGPAPPTTAAIFTDPSPSVSFNSSDASMCTTFLQTM